MSKAIFNLPKIPLNTPQALWADHTEEWMGDILNELNDGFEQSEREEVNSFMRLKGEIHKVKDDQFGEVVIVAGELSSRFCALCGRSGDMIGDEINIELKAALLEKSVIEDNELGEEVNIVIKDQEYDLFSYENNRVDLTPVIKEYVYLNKNPYPMKG